MVRRVSHDQFCARDVKFSKYHGLGNSYIVVDGRQVAAHLTWEAFARQICHTGYGIGSDGLLVDCSVDGFAVRIFNPDGSEAEKSGNGLRIFARWLWDTGRVTDLPFGVGTAGGPVQCQVLAQNQLVRVQMGPVHIVAVFEAVSVQDQTLDCTVANVGNPHCVVFSQTVDKTTALTLGPLVEMHQRFPLRTNVQFVRVMDRNNVAIEIWERGAGYTLSSGSSSCAVVAACRERNLCDDTVTVHMPGGALEVAISPDLNATLTGKVARICTGWYRTGS